MRDTTFWDEMDLASDEYQLAYDLIRHAMGMVWKSAGQSHLTRLKNVLEKASVFVNDELDDLPEKTEELGLDNWQREECEQEEEDRLIQEEREEERRQEEEWQQLEDAKQEATNR
jgi:hypothetical protein